MFNWTFHDNERRATTGRGTFRVKNTASNPYVVFDVEGSSPRYVTLDGGLSSTKVEFENEFKAVRAAEKYAQLHGLAQSSTSSPSSAPTPRNKENHSMSTDATLALAKRAVTHGGQVAFAAEADSRLVDIFERMLGESYPAVFKTENGRKMARALFPLAVHYGVTTGLLPVPEAEKVKYGCELAVEAASRDVIQPYLSLLAAAVLEFAKVVPEPEARPSKK